ncbi:MAG: anthranilate synthase component I family protein [Sphingobacteriales bacterium]|nr:MAG: anthranilate synthase component I family protein [Sphingobacteriales bacterium]
MSTRNTASFAFREEDLQTIKNKMLNWLRPFSIFSYLDNNRYQHGPNRFEMIAGAGQVQSSRSIDTHGEDWLFGHISYDYKNQVEEQLNSRYADFIGFEDIAFFQPQTVVYIRYKTCELQVHTLESDADTVLQVILSAASVVSNDQEAIAATPAWQYRFDEDSYCSAVQQIRSHIEDGDCYEMNFCTEAFATRQQIDPVFTFHQLNVLNPSPFAGLYRNDAAWLICASPERFLHKQEDTLLSQPIKGTSRRSADAAEDERLKTALYNNPKERAENVMIVDLVRNDLARSCLPGSVQVPELFGVYTLPQVHQLISTVTGRMQPGLPLQTAIDNAFPMGSMTGAPKFIVMELTEVYEHSRRGLYAGSIGYVTPEGDFDFNVVIRSLLYNQGSGYLSYQTGGAITYDSDPQAEWAEVRLKARAMEQVFL